MEMIPKSFIMELTTLLTELRFKFFRSGILALETYVCRYAKDIKRISKFNLIKFIVTTN